jgi:hypothetical protein
MAWMACVFIVGCSGSSSPAIDGTNSDGGGSGSGNGNGNVDGSTAGPAPTGGGSGNGTDASTAPPPSSTDAGAPSTPDAAVASDAAPPATPYPSGPYGITAGDVITNLQWIGYVDDAADAVASTKPYVSYSLDDARKSGKKYAMVNLAETDCPGCQKSAGEIAAGGASVVQAGGVVIEVLMTTGFIAQASKSDLDGWVAKYKLPVTTVKDPDGTGTATYTALGQREQAYIIDLSTMKIVKVIAGDISGIGATSGGLGMTEMHTLLGK